MTPNNTLVSIRFLMEKIFFLFIVCTHQFYGMELQTYRQKEAFVNSHDHLDATEIKQYEFNVPTLDARLNQDNTLLSVAVSGGTACVCDMETCKRLLTVYHCNNSDEKQSVLYARLHKNNTLLTAASSNGTACVWDTRTSELLLHVNHFAKPCIVNWLRKAKLNKENTELTTFCGGSDNGFSISKWDLSTGKQLINEVIISPFERPYARKKRSIFITTSFNKEACIFTIGNEKPVVKTFHDSYTTSGRLDSTGKNFITASGNGTVRIWSLSETSDK